MTQVHQYNRQILNSQFYLNDIVINDYLKLIVARNQNMYAFDTYFYCRYSTGGFKTVQRWTKKVNIFSKSKLFIPINLIQPKWSHWYLICVDVVKKTISYYDSMKGVVRPDIIMSTIMRYLWEEHLEKLNSVLDVSEWTFIDAVCPAQKNGMDCGVFLCAISEYLSRDAQFNFTQDHMMSFRQLIAHELTLKRLLNVNDEDEKKLLKKLFNFM